MNVKLQQYNDSVYYESLVTDPGLDGIRDFFVWFSKNYQTGKIKLDISVGLSTKYLDIPAKQSISYASTWL